jgi:multiple sugar transport system ATP-binding protein
MAEVRIDRLRKEYRGGVNALHETSLVFADGEFTCVLGPSGSGKSTLLRMIAGIEETTSGRIFFDGEDVTQVTPERRDVAMVFQTYGLYPNMTIRDNIAFPLMLRRTPRADRERQVLEVAEMLGIADKLNRQPRALSGGERQRVALARAIVRKPRVFLLDEPISNLDAHLRATTREWLKRLHAQLGATFIYVTHDQDDAEAMSDRVVVMAAGSVKQYDTPGAIYRRPANRFVASFVGRLPMNFIEGSLVDDAGRAWFEAGSVRVDLGPTGTVSTGGRVVLGVRPEGVVLQAGGGGSGTRGTITLTEVITPDVYATAAVGDVSVRARLGFDDAVRVGDQVMVSFVRSQVLFFDPTSGERLTLGAGGPDPDRAPVDAVG